MSFFNRGILLFCTVGAALKITEGERSARGKAAFEHIRADVSTELSPEQVAEEITTAWRDVRWKSIAIELVENEEMRCRANLGVVRQQAEWFSSRSRDRAKVTLI